MEIEAFFFSTLLDLIWFTPICAGPTLIEILPVKFYIYEELKKHVPEEYENSITMCLSCGALAGLFGQTFTYPLDVVRRQMQVRKLACVQGIKGAFELGCSVCPVAIKYNKIFFDAK